MRAKAAAAGAHCSKAGGRPATGVTDAEGRYRLTTISSDDGAPLGSYSVSIAKTEMPAASAADKFGLLPARRLLAGQQAPVSSPFWSASAMPGRKTRA